MIRIFSLCALTVLLCCASTNAEVPQATKLRIVSFNSEILTAPRVRAGSLQRYRFDYARDQHLERVAAVIETLQPDILNLVEVTSKEAVDRLVAILHEKGLTDYQGYHVESNDSFTGMDVALISKIEPDMVDGQAIRTYFSKDDDPLWRQAFTFTGWDGSRQTKTTSVSRNAVYYVTVAGKKLGFLGLHLKSNPQDEYANAKRTAEAKVAERILRGEIVKRGYEPIVLGDLNDYDPDVEDRDDTRAPTTDVIRGLKDFDAETPGPELFNAAKYVVRKSDRYTSHWDWNENGAHDPQDVYTMIDHILLPVSLESSVEHVFISRCVSVDTSDHYPVVVDLKLSGNTPAQR